MSCFHWHYMEVLLSPSNGWLWYCSRIVKECTLVSQENELATLQLCWSPCACTVAGRGSGKHTKSCIPPRGICTMESVGVFTIGMLGRGRRGLRNADGYVKFLLAADTFRYLVMVIHVCTSSTTPPPPCVRLWLVDISILLTLLIVPIVNYKFILYVWAKCMYSSHSRRKALGCIITC